MSEMLEYSAIKTAHQTREYEEQKNMTRKRNLLVLIWEHLKEAGYLDTAEALQSEVNLELNRFAVCDNIGLDSILRDYETYFYVRFQKYPKIVKSVEKVDEKLSNTTNQRFSNKLTNSETKYRQRRINSCIAAIPKSSSPSNEIKSIGGDQTSKQNLSLDGQRLPVGKNSKEKETSKTNISELPKEIIDDSYRLLKPLGLFMTYDDEWKELACIISKEIYQRNPGVKWNDIAGLDEAKRLVKEAILYPIKYPDMFTGILSPWKGILLYGPSGTGKTLLAKALATECKTTFFNISASSIVSKWRGDSEKLVRVLFELARFHAPSTIFIDELDSVMSQRDSMGMREHEASRRMKTEILIQMDGINKSDNLVFLLAASNLPWELDHAVLRRLEKRILVDLPDETTRSVMFKQFLPPVIKLRNGLEIQCNLQYDQLAQTADGYSGADIALVCKETAMEKMRRVIDCLEQGGETSMNKISLDLVSNEDVCKALNKMRPSAKEFKAEYEIWRAKFGST